MPNRTLREAIVTDERIDALTPSEERLYFRLRVNLDDFGRFDARPAVVRARCFPLKGDEVKLAAVSAWLDRLEEVGLIRRYEVDGRPYLEATDWEDHRRAKHSKYPAPPWSEAPEACTTPSAPALGEGYPPAFEAFWACYPRRVEKKRALACWKATLRRGAAPEDLIRAATLYANEVRRHNTAEQYIKHPATFLGPNEPWKEVLGRGESEGHFGADAGGAEQCRRWSEYSAVVVGPDVGAPAGLEHD